MIKLSMPKKWSLAIEVKKRKELCNLYVKKNLTIGEISKIIKISQGSVYDRLLRLGIKSTPHLKKGYKNFKNIPLPKLSCDLAECVGILLGDGHISFQQVFIMLGNKEGPYVQYVRNLFWKVFKIEPKLITRNGGYSVLYFSSVKIIKFLSDMGLVSNKVKYQVSVPGWIFRSNRFGERFLRGFFDTDGSAYNLKFGFQVSFCNSSRPLLENSRDILIKLGYKPSRISLKNLYLTRKSDLINFLYRIRPANINKYSRLENYIARVGTQVDNEG